MFDNSNHFQAAATTGLGTSAHETGTGFSIPSLNSNRLRFYSPLGTRRRKPSATSEMRAGLCAALASAHAGIRKITIRDTGICFHSHVKLRSGRVIFRKAYSLQNLAGMLAEGINLMEKGGNV